MRVKFKQPYMIKSNSYNFNVMRYPYKNRTLPWKVFFATISTEILGICRATSSVVQVIKTSKVFLHQMLLQGTFLLGVKKVLVKMVNRHVLQFDKYNTKNRDLIQHLFNITCWCCFCLMCICMYITYSWYVLMCMCVSSSYCFG